MALKSDRNEFETNISFFMNEVATRGGIASMSTGGSGAAMDQSAALVTYANASGSVPLGILLNDMVNLDLTRQHINFAKDEVQKGGKVTLLRKGWVVTSNVEGTTDSLSKNPVAGDPVFVAHSGNLAAVPVFTDQSGTSTAVIGTFLSSADENGYYKVEINLPAGTSRVANP